MIYGCIAIQNQPPVLSILRISAISIEILLPFQGKALQSECLVLLFSTEIPCSFCSVCKLHSAYCTHTTFVNRSVFVKALEGFIETIGVVWRNLVFSLPPPPFFLLSISSYPSLFSFWIIFFPLHLSVPKVSENSISMSQNIQIYEVKSM